MHPFQTALNEHLQGRLPEATLLDSCDAALAAGDLPVDELRAMADAARSEGLDPAVHAALRERIDAAPETSAPAPAMPPATGDGGETRLQSTPPAAPPAETHEPTRLAPGAGPASGAGPGATGAGNTTGGASSGWTNPADWEESPGGPARPGSVLKDRFVLESIIARGGMGVVYKARDLRKEEAHDRNPYLAVKVLTEDFRRHPDAFIALQREAKKAQSLAHPNVVTVYDFDRDGRTVFMTMELLEGESLSQVLKQLPPGGMEPKKAIELVDGMAEALAYAHRKGIVHSDFKPGNVFITREGVVKVLDFGIARAVKRPGHEQDVTLFDPGSLGALTPGYASCEMFEGEEPDPRDDIYGLACVAYELVAGRHPFNRLTAVQARDNRITPQTPKRLGRGQWRALQHALAFRRGERTPSVEQFMAELRPPKGRRLLAALAAVIVIAALAGGGGYLWNRMQGERLDARFAALEAAIGADRLAPPAEDNAAALLAALAADAAGDPRLEQARANLALAYLRHARAARAEGEWAAARAQVEAGREAGAGAAVNDALDAELALIEAGERNADRFAEQRAREARAAGLREQFAAGLEAMPPTAEGAAPLLDLLRELGQVAPTDPLLVEGRRQVAERLAGAVEALAAEGQWDAGESLLAESLRLLPESERLGAARDTLEQAREQATAAERERQRQAEAERQRQLTAQVNQHRRAVDALLAKPTFSPQWEQQVRGELAAVERLVPADDPWLVQTRTRLNELYRSRQQAQQPPPSRTTTTTPPTQQRSRQPPPQQQQQRPPPGGVGMDLDQILKEFETGGSGEVR